jgi:MBG domain (YGX type)
VTAVYSSDNSYAGNSGNRGLTVAKALLTVTAVNETKKQGAANPALTYTITGFVNGDKSTVVKGKPTLSTTAVKTSKAGSYSIIVALGSLSATNYAFTLVNGTLTVTGMKAPAISVAVAQVPDSEVSPSPFDRLIPTWWRKGLSRR